MAPLSARTLVALFAVGLTVRSVAALFLSEPYTQDAAYYYQVAANVAEGRGLTIAVIWNYLHCPQSLVHPSHAYWMPLTSLILAPFLKILGSSYAAAKVPMVLLSAVMPVFTYLLARKVLESEKQAVLAGLLCLFHPLYFVRLGNTDTTAVFSFFAVGALLVVSSPRMTLNRQALAGGVLSGLAYLTRRDGLLVLIALLLVILFGRGENRPGKKRLSATILGGVAFLAVIAPWTARNLVLFDAVMPGGGAVFYLRDYHELFAYPQTATLTSYLEQGMGAVLLSKLIAMAALLIMIALTHTLYLFPVSVAGMWVLRRHRALRPFLVYAVLMILSVSLLASEVALSGSFIHTQAALFPLYATGIVKGVERMVRWAARKSPDWNPDRAVPNFLAVVLVVQMVSCGFLAAEGPREEAERYETYRTLAAWMDEETGPESAVMIADPSSFHYLSGRPAMMIPSNSYPATREAAIRYGARFLVLERRDLPPWIKSETGPDLDLELRKSFPGPGEWEARVYALP